MSAPGYMLSFDGSDDSILVGSTNAFPSGNSAYSWEAWVRAGTVGMLQNFFSWGLDGLDGRCVQIGLDTSGTVVINHWGAVYSWVTGYTMPVGEWTHLAGTYNGSGVETLYVNGIPAATKTTVSRLERSRRTGT
jgi:hypothetical protein